MSQASTVSASSAATRMEWMSSGRGAIFMCVGDRAALLREPRHVDDADAEPVEMRRHAEHRADGDDAGAADAGDEHAHASCSSVGDLGLRHRRQSPRRDIAVPAFSRAPCTVTKEGQKPSRQEKSLLQLDCSIVRLRPNSVSSGCTETQFDFTPQSPQPSQTSVLMTTRLSGSG